MLVSALFAVSVLINTLGFTSYFKSKDTCCMAGMYVLWGCMATAALGIISMLLVAMCFKRLRIGFRILGLLPIIYTVIMFANGISRL